MQVFTKSLLCLSALLCFKANAQTNEELDPVTVTSSLSPLSTSKTGRNILLIKSEQIAKLPVNSIDELLRYLPGIEIQARGPMGAQSDIVLRGGTFQQVLVILDGIRLNDPNTGHFSSYIPIAPSEIDRIEVLKGGSSAIYGSDAVGGVIHIITKSFNSKGAVKQNVSAQVAAGEYGLANVNAGAFYSNGKTAIGGGILSNNATWQQQRGTKGYFNLNTASLSVNHQINEAWQLGFRTAFDNRKFAAQNFYSNLMLDTANEKVQTIWNQARVAYQKEKNKFSFNLGYKAVDDQFQLNPSFVANKNKSNLLQALAVYDHAFTDKTTLTTGTQFQNRKIASNDRGNHTVQQAAGFLILNQLIGSDFRITPAVRYDWNELSGAEWVPQINLSYRISKFQLRGSAGKTIRNADFTEQYNNYNKPPFVGSGNRIGNPDLKAEYSFSYEAGADVFLSNAIKISSSYFQRDYDDLIDYVSTPYANMPRRENLAPAGTFFLAKNISQVTTKGFETDIQFQKTVSNNHQLYTTVGLVWLNSKSNNRTPSLYISSHANFLTNFSVQYNTPIFNISANGLYKKRNTQQTVDNPRFSKAAISKDYFVMNVKAEAFVVKEKVSVFAQADNILDRTYSDLLGAIMPGRWLMGGIRLSLNK